MAQSTSHRRLRKIVNHETGLRQAHLEHPVEAFRPDQRHQPLRDREDADIIETRTAVPARIAAQRLLDGNDERIADQTCPERTANRDQRLALRRRPER